MNNKTPIRHKNRQTYLRTPLTYRHEAGTGSKVESPHKHPCISINKLTKEQIVMSANPQTRKLVNLQTFKSANLPTIFTLIIILSLTACSSKKINYLQPPKGAPADSLYQQTCEAYKVQPGDILYVDIFSPDPEVSQVFNSLQAQTTTTNATLGGFYIIGYTVSETGNIELPIIGKVNVEGLTMPEINAKILEAAKTYIKAPQVSAKLVSFTVSVLGEVGRPGRYNIYRDKMNILDVIGMAGDITYYGNRREVNIMRNTPKGTYTYIVDLTKRDLLASSNYFMAPNDIIYVQPRKLGLFRKNASDYALFLTTLSSTLTTVLLIINISK